MMVMVSAGALALHSRLQLRQVLLRTGLVAGLHRLDQRRQILAETRLGGTASRRRAGRLCLLSLLQCA